MRSSASIFFDSHWWVFINQCFIIFVCSLTYLSFLFILLIYFSSVHLFTSNWIFYELKLEGVENTKDTVNRNYAQTGFFSFLIFTRFSEHFHPKVPKGRLMISTAILCCCLGLLFAPSSSAHVLINGKH